MSTLSPRRYNEKNMILIPGEESIVIFNPESSHFLYNWKIRHGEYLTCVFSALKVPKTSSETNCKLSHILSDLRGDSCLATSCYLDCSMVTFCALGTTRPRFFSPCILVLFPRFGSGPPVFIEVLLVKIPSKQSFLRHELIYNRG